MRIQSILVVFIVIALSSFGAHGGSFDPDMESTRQEILASRQRRKVQLQGMLQEAQQQLEDDQLGRRILDTDERTALEKKVDLYSRKLETMQGELDEREVERIIKREQLRNERIREKRKFTDEL